MSLVYIDKNGNYGGADGMLVFDIAELTENQVSRLNRCLDEGASLWSWVFEENLVGEGLQQKPLRVEGCAYIHQMNFSSEHIEKFFDRMLGR